MYMVIIRKDDSKYGINQDTFKTVLTITTLRLNVLVTCKPFFACGAIKKTSK